MFRSVIIFLILLSLISTVAGRVLSIYSVYNPIKGTFGLLFDFSIDVWEYHARLSFSPMLVSNNGSIFLVGKLKDPADIFREIWFESERLDVTYSEVPNPELSDPNIFMAGGKSFTIDLMDTFGVSYFPGGLSFLVRSAGDIAGFTRISTRNGEMSFASGLRLWRFTLGLCDSLHCFVGYSSDRIDLGIPLQGFENAWLIFKSRYASAGFVFGQGPSFRLVEKVTPFNLSVTANSSGWSLSGGIEVGKSRLVISIKSGRLEEMSVTFKLF
ncbi:MAG: hypothetical protein J7J80_09135 [Thermotogae bacterium]|nr:hypothetical protein [Thermotogota bacterium]